MSARTIAEKLVLRRNERSIILNPPEGYLERLPDGLRLDTRLDGEYDFIQVFVRRRAELDAQWGTIKQHLTRGGKLWVSYPKARLTNSDLTPDALPNDPDIESDAQVSLDDRWSARRFRRLR